MNSIKYPRTYHFSFSPGATRDDKMATSMESLIGVPIVLTEKVDGSNTSLEKEGVYARTHAHTPTHPSFDLLKAFYSNIKHLISFNTQLFGENCYAKHSIKYNELPGYFLLFNVAEYGTNRDGKFHRIWLDWDSVEAWAKKINVPTVPVLFKGIVSSEKELKELVESLMSQPSACGGIREGVVARIAGEFLDKDFSTSIMKCVLANHVSTDSDHWKHKDVIRNGLCKK